MSGITYVTGNLLKSDEKVIAHGCNCLGFMGGGIARYLGDSHPAVKAEYERACTGGEFQLGTAQPVFEPSLDRLVFNLGTQKMMGGNATYWGIMLSFGNMFEYCARNGITRVAIPRIGCGIGELDWKTVEFVINGIYDYVPNGPDVVVYTLEAEVSKFA